MLQKNTQTELLPQKNKKKFHLDYPTNQILIYNNKATYQTN